MRALAVKARNLLLGFLVGGLIGLAGTLLLPLMTEPVKAPTVDKQAADAAELAKVNDCWTAEQGTPPDMVGVIPGHVVAARGQRAAVYSVDLVGPALEHVFEGRHPNLRVFAFCR